MRPPPLAEVRSLFFNVIVYMPDLQLKKPCSKARKKGKKCFKHFFIFSYTSTFKRTNKR